MPSPSKREVVVDTALKLFKTKGINSTGVEEIIKTANISKKTLYNHFKSKEELVLATLRKDDEIGRNALMKFAEQASDDPIQKIMAIFDFYKMWFESPTFKGCLFINSAAEIAEDSNSLKHVCTEHKILIAKYIEKLAEQSHVKNPKELAKRLNLLLEGAIVYAFVVKDDQSALRAKEMANITIAHHFSSELS